jgi:murein DD-endopeptidase MepM/ murein hydrolase activator NlpD
MKVVIKYMRHILGNKPHFKSLYVAICFGASITSASVFALSSTAPSGYYVDALIGSSPTLALAPLSIGNPIAAFRGIETVSPNTPNANLVADYLINVSVNQSIKAKRGDTLAALLNRAGASNQDTAKAISAAMPLFNPKHFRQGQVVNIEYRADKKTLSAGSAAPGAFHGFSILPNIATELKIERTKDGSFKAWEIKRTLTTQPTKSKGTITSSLYLAGVKAGLKGSTLAELIRAYSWDVDFQRDIRKGDSFEVIYDQIIDDKGNIVKSNVIQYAALTLSGIKTRIFRFKTEDGNTNYYNEKGHSAQKALMRTPIDGARLSSGFGRRKHPILGYTKMHKGVDFAAPRGTPIYAAGKGTVTYAGRKGAYGNFISIRHNRTFTTVYAHMKGFSRKIRKGSRVNQGQIIGYVGTTGRSTGPHLHYEIRKNNRQANPLRIKMPSGKKLKGSQLTTFLTAKDQIEDTYAALPFSPQQVASKN